MFRGRSVLSLLTVLFITGLAWGAENIAPQAGWRCVPAAIHAGDDEPGLKPLMEGRDAEWKPAAAAPWMTFRFQADRPAGPVMMTYSVPGSRRAAVMHLESRSVSEGDEAYAEVAAQPSGGLLQKFIFQAQADREYRLRATWPPATTQPARLRISDIGFYDLSGERRKDYWLVIGASIQAQSIRQAVFKKLAAERFPQADPVVFNLAVGGWKASDLLAALPGFLREHPHAAYVLIHIGGNDVTPRRPYPGGADRLRAELTAILEMVRDAGKIPVLARLSYRAYKGAKPVPPESNGSGPYVVNIYDPLVRKYCPLFYDEALGRGRVDAYEWFKAHPDELTGDGVHVNDKGKLSWNRLWVEKAGPFIYGATPSTSSSPSK